MSDDLAYCYSLHRQMEFYPWTDFHLFLILQITQLTSDQPVTRPADCLFSSSGLPPLWACNMECVHYVTEG